MKIDQRTWIWILVVLCLSCNDWLDLTPEGAPTEKDLFKEAEGYRTALNGLYQNMGKSSLYGTNLQFGMVDLLSQQYDINENNNTYKTLIEVSKMNYNDNGVQGLIAATWLDAYNVIANANNLIQNMLKQDTTFFEKGKMEYDMILGEAYACRALMHFDLLRLFAPAKVADDGQNYIPYVEEYPVTRPAGSSVDDCLAKIVADLERARSLCMTFDTTDLGMNAVCTGESRFYNKYPSFTEMNTHPDLLDDFFKGRGYRLNYYSITALLARVCQYAGRFQEAFDYAGEVLEFTYKASDWDIFTLFEFSSDGVNLGSDNTTVAFEAKDNLKMVDNLIFALYNEKAYDNLGLAVYFAKELYGNYPQYFVIKQQDIFETPDGNSEIANDIRSTKLIFMANGNYPVSGKWFWHNDESKRQNNVTILPVLRASEMEYIRAEYYARNRNWTEAAGILNAMRAERGCFQEVSFSSWEDFVRYLVNDARREWISEGQLFYLYKRLGAEVDFGNGDRHVLKREEAVLPMPSSQSI